MRSSILWFMCVCLPCLPGIFLGCENEGPANPPANTDPLQGAWKGHFLGDDTWKFSLTFSGNTMSSLQTSPQGPSISSTGTFTTNTAVTPAHLDILIATYPSHPDYAGKTSLCIYKISNDTLTFAGNEPGNTQRPASFVPSTSTAVFILKKR